MSKVTFNDLKELDLLELERQVNLLLAIAQAASSPDLEPVDYPEREQLDAWENLQTAIAAWKQPR